MSAHTPGLNSNVDLVLRAEKCYVCGKPIKAHRPVYSVYLEDDGHRAVPAGSDCRLRVAKAGYDGVQTKGGPRVFIEQRFAANWPAYSAAIALATGA